MAIPIEGYTVVAQRDRIQELLDNEKVPNPNVTVLADDHIWRCSFMTHEDAVRFAKSLESRGLNISHGPDSDVVIINEFDLAISPYCEWLQAARWEKAVIAWRVGSEPRTVAAREGWDPKIGSGLSFRTSTEGLEFVRLDTEKNVEVYRDKTTDQLVYIGRTSTPVEALSQSAANIIRKHFRVVGQPPATGSDADEVSSAIAMLDRVNSEAPNNWRVLWFRGKGYLSLGKLASAYDDFYCAYSVEKNEQAIPRELAGVCLALGKFEEGLQVAQEAVMLHPDTTNCLATWLSHICLMAISSPRSVLSKPRRRYSRSIQSTVILRP
jgi:tetratricopeptide (TPR) repeat protein